MEIKKYIYIYTCCIYYDHVNKCPGSILSCFCITHCASNFIIFILIIISNRSFSVITMVQVCCKEKEYTSKIAFNCFNKWTLIIHLIKYCQLISNNTAVWLSQSHCYFIKLSVHFLNYLFMYGVGRVKEMLETIMSFVWGRRGYTLLLSLHLLYSFLICNV